MSIESKHYSKIEWKKEGHKRCLHCKQDVEEGVVVVVQEEGLPKVVLTFCKKCHPNVSPQAIKLTALFALKRNLG